MFRRITVLLIFIIAGIVSAESGFYFLRTEKTPALISTAQTSYLFSGTVRNMEYNPASVLSGSVFEGSVSYSSPDEDESVIDFSTAYSENDVLYGMQLSYMSIKGLEGREVPSDDPAYDFGARNMIVSFTYARKFKSGFIAGITGKYLFEKIEYDDASGLAGSIGIYRENNFTDGLNLGLAVNNFGSLSKLDTESADLPIDVVFGAGYGIALAGDFRIDIGNSTRYLVSDEETENFSGMEIGYQNKAFVRFGYRANNEGSPFSAGIGFSINNITFDYSYTPFTDDAVNDNHAVSVGYCIK